MENISQILADPAFQIVILAVVIAGVARGFSGFGTGMIVAPIAAAMYSPQVALILLVVMDSWPSAVPAIQARKKVQWGEVLPIVFGFVLALPLGIAFIKYGDAITLRWFISAIILVAVSVLWSGWQYRGPRNFPISASVGAMCGFLGGSTQIPGPPAIIYWMATRTGGRHCARQYFDVVSDHGIHLHGRLLARWIVQLGCRVEGYSGIADIFYRHHDRQ